MTKIVVRDLSGLNVGMHHTLGQGLGQGEISKNIGFWVFVVPSLKILLL